MKNPSVALSATVIFGAWLGAIIPLSWLVFIAFILLFALAYKLARFGIPLKSISFIFLAAMVVMFGTGLFRAQFVRYSNLSKITPFVHKQVNVIGEVLNIETYDKNTVVELKTYRIEYSNEQYKTIARLCLIVYGSEFEANIRDIISVNGKIELFRPMNFWGDYSRRSNYASMGMFAKISSPVSDIKFIGDNKKAIDITAWGFNARTHINKTVDKYLKGDEGALEKGILIGNRKDFSDELKDAFKKSGMSHIVAVSGIHVSIFIIFITFGVWGLFTNRIGRAYLLVAAIFAYTVVIGNQPSILRAALMAAFGVMVENAKLRRDTLTALMVSTAILTVINPYLVHNVSFQLSFLATLGIILLQGRICKYAVANAGVAAFLYTAPLLAYSFNTITFASLITNIIVSPLVIISLLLGYIMCVIPYSGVVLSPVIFCMNHVMILVSKFFASIKFLTVSIASPGFEILICTIAALYILHQAVNGNGKRLRTLFASAVFVLMLLFNVFTAVSGMKDIKVNFVATDSGDCVHVRTTNGLNLMADSGDGSGTLSFLRSKNIQVLDSLILTNLTADNTSFAAYLMDNISICEIYLPYEGNDELKSIADNKGIKVNYYKRGDSITVDNVRFDVLMYDKNGKPSNNATAAIKMTCFDTKFMLLGKFDSKHEHEMINSYSKEAIKSDVVRLANKAFETSNSQELIQVLGARYAIDNNRYNSPSKLPSEVYNRLSSADTRTLKTYLSGTIGFEINKKGIKAIKRTRIPLEEEL